MSARHLCLNYEIRWTTTVLAVGADGIRVRSEIDHVGSTAGCTHKTLPSNCKQETVTTWTLAREACPARCDASYSGPFQYAEGDPAPNVATSGRCP